MSHWRRVALTTFAVALAACGGSADGGGSYTSGPTTQPTPPSNPGNTNPGSVATNSVTVSSATFDPANISITAGTTVNWEWNSCTGDGYGGYSSCVSHGIVFDDGSGITSGVQTSGTFSRTFNVAGTYKYHCAIHGQSMSGMITVK
jgi:plastocyanin